MEQAPHKSSRPATYRPFAASGSYSSWRRHDGSGSEDDGKEPAEQAGQDLPDGASRRITEVSNAGTIRVLVVDDQPDVLATTVELFKIMGYEVLSAANGSDAVAILRCTPDVQVLFSDVVMPGMNGLSLAREARRLVPGINIILASGFQASAIDPQGGNIRDFHFLSKPFRIADIAKLLRK